MIATIGLIMIVCAISYFAGYASAPRFIQVDNDHPLYRIASEALELSLDSEVPESKRRSRLHTLRFMLMNIRREQFND